MSHDFIVVSALVAPALLMLFLRVNAAMVFLSLCLGSVLVQYVAGQANDFWHFFMPGAGSFSDSSVKLFLLLAPAVVTGIITVSSVRGRFKSLFNILPVAATSALAVLLAAPLLPKNFKDSFGAPAAWQALSKSQALVVGIGAVISLFVLWTQRSLFRQSGKHKH